MVDTSSKRRKKVITESDIATLLQRYDMATILKLLQEMSYYSDIKMDWNELVKKTTTGITNAREYQLLWRHLSYREPLLPVDDNDQPLDDDSDMECELEASPAVSFEASMEAIAHVKVIAASYVPSKSDNFDDSTVEAPLTINIPYGLPEGTQESSESPWSSKGMNSIFPVCLRKATFSEGINGNGLASTNMASQRKGKWSAEEDEELIATVKRCGEGNWAHIVKAEFRGERTASQLSKRWALIRKRVDTPTAAIQSGLQQTEAHLAVNHALSLAVGDHPPSKRRAIGISPMTSSCRITETHGNEGNPSQGHQQAKPVVQAFPGAETSVPTSKSRAVTKKRTANSISRSDLMVTANSAVAAACRGGVRTAASVPKVEPGKTDAPFVPMTQPVKNASAAYMPRPSGSLSVLKVEPGKSSIPNAVGPANPRPVANGNMKLVTTTSSSASRTVSNQRVSAASVPATTLQPKPTAETKPDGGQKEQAGKDGSNSLTVIQPDKKTTTNSDIATQAQSTNLLPRKIPVVQTAIQGVTNQKLMNKPSDKTGVPSISGAKCEVNRKVGAAIKMSNVCGKPPDVAGTGQGV